MRFYHFIKGNLVSSAVQCCYKSGGVKGSGAVDTEALVVSDIY